MKQTIAPAFLLMTVCILLTSCNMATPENYFDRAVLNSNMLMGVADGLERELEQPSAKLVEGTKDQTVSMTRKEVIKDKVKWLEEALEKIKDLKETDDAKDILKSSVAVYEYVLPVYKNEYIQLAKLYDDAAPKEQIAFYTKSIHDKYSPGFEERINTLINNGKTYAAKHQINVKWDVKTSPDLH